MHERRSALFDVRPCRVERLFEEFADELDLRTVIACRVDLRHRSVLGDEDRRVRTGLARRPGNRLPVVACARRDDSCTFLFVGERRDLVDRAAHLERTGALEVLRLQPHLAPGQPSERLRPVHGRDARDAVDPGARLLDVSECGDCRRGQA